jgi:transposase
VFTGLGHTVKLIPPAYVKPYVKSQKNDAADAEAICEAVTRPTMPSSNTARVRSSGLTALGLPWSMLCSGGNAMR